MIQNWTYYNHAIISTLEPHEIANTSAIDDGSIWHGWGATSIS